MRHRWRKYLIWVGCACSILITVRLLSGKALACFSNLFASCKDSDDVHNLNRKSEQFNAGSYMAGRWPRNVSFCQWQYELPSRLPYHADRVSGSPERGDKSSYRVLSSVIEARSDETKKLPALTLCTHATADQVYNIVEIVRRWEGPVSLSVFVPGADAGLSVALLDRACKCEPAMAKVSVHFVFPVTHPPTLSATYNGEGDCLALDFHLKESVTVREKLAMTYPINVARNVARKQAHTVRVMVSDIELLPSERLASSFMEMVQGKLIKTQVVFAVPVFEIEAAEEPPKNKQQLLVACKLGTAGYFHRFVCPHCQNFPGLTRWMLTPDRGRATPLLDARREVPHHRWEPVFIGTKDDPLYTEDMTWEGRQDKMVQMFEMCLLDYHLIVLDGVFLVHTPGIKRKPANRVDKLAERFRPYERQNSRIYQSVTRRLLKLHRTDRKCRQ